jgi:hypothetical protein
VLVCWYQRSCWWFRRGGMRWLQEFIAGDKLLQVAERERTDEREKTGTPRMRPSGGGRMPTSMFVAVHAGGAHGRDQGQMGYRAAPGLVSLPEMDSQTEPGGTSRLTVRTNGGRTFTTVRMAASWKKKRRAAGIEC